MSHPYSVLALFYVFNFDEILQNILNNNIHQNLKFKIFFIKKLCENAYKIRILILYKNLC